MTAKEYKAHLRQKLKEQIELTEYYRKESERVDQDRRKYQAQFAARYRWWIELLGKEKVPILGPLIEKDAKFLQTVEYFSW